MTKQIYIIRTEIAKLMGISVNALSLLIRSPNFNFPRPAKHIHKTILYDRAEVLQFIEARKTKERQEELAQLNGAPPISFLSINSGKFDHKDKKVQYKKARQQAIENHQQYLKIQVNIHEC